MRRKHTSLRKSVEELRTSALDAELIRREAHALAADFKAFVVAAWSIIEPGTEFLDGLPVNVICEHLQACAEGRIKKLLVNIPPRHSKSSLISVLFPAWLWTRNPGIKVLSASYSDKLATRDCQQSRRLIESDWYRARWPDVILADDENLKTSYLNTKMGRRQTCTVNGTTTGLGGDVLILDDPHNVQDGESATVRESAVQWFRESFYNRTNNSRVIRIVIMQRVHYKDVSANIIDRGDFQHLNLPMEYEGVKSAPTCLGWQDPREKHGEVLWPERFAPEEVEDLKKNGEYQWAGQYQQRPVPRGGAIFKRSWLKFWYDPARGVPDPVLYQDEKGEWFPSEHTPFQCEASKVAATGDGLTSWDMAFKGTEESDFVVGQAWLRSASGFYLLDQERGRWDFPASCAAVRRLSERWPFLTKLVEAKANGEAVIAQLTGEIPGFIPVTPEGGKESRAAAIAVLFEAGNVYLPHPDQFPWVLKFIEELCQFPKGINDDQVDSMTQALVRLQTQRVELVEMGVYSESAFHSEMLIAESPWVI